MFLWIRSSGLIKWLAGSLAALVLNLSVDAPSYSSVDQQSQLPVNEQESIVELVLEQVMGIEDAIPESDDPPQNDVMKKSGFKVDMRMFSEQTILTPILDIADKRNPVNADERAPCSVYIGKLTPPPEV